MQSSLLYQTLERHSRWYRIRSRHAWSGVHPCRVFFGSNEANRGIFGVDDGILLGLSLRELTGLPAFGWGPCGGTGPAPFSGGGGRLLEGVGRGGGEGTE